MLRYLLISPLPVFEAALDFVKNHPQDPVNQMEFEDACGVGVIITPEQIEDAVSACTYIIILFLQFSLAAVRSSTVDLGAGGDCDQKVSGTAVKGEVSLQHGTANG